MSDIDTAEYVGRFEFVNFGHCVPEDHFARFVVHFVKSFFKFFNYQNEVVKAAEPGRKGYSFIKMACLIYYAYANGITESKEIEYRARYDKIYIYVCNGIEPSYKTIENFIKKWGSFFDLFISYTINYARLAGFTGMEHVAFDGTVKKAANNKFNVVHREDVRILLRYYKGKIVTERELKKLRRPARNLVKRLDLTNKQKIELLEKIDKRFDETGKNTVPVNDIEAIHMVDKKGNNIIDYNIQTAVDNMSKMFCAIMISQKATDHGQLPEVFKKVVDNIGENPQKISADSAYNTYETLLFINENNIDAYLDNIRQAKLRNGHGSKKIFHKDNMDFDHENNCFNCYAHNQLYHQDTKYKYNSKKGTTEVRAEFYNEEACEGCIFRLECCKGKKYRKVIVGGGELALKMEEKMLDYASIYEYLKRFCTVEPPNGSLKIFYHINEMLARGTSNIENKLLICAGSYNLKLLYKHIMKIFGSRWKFYDKNEHIYNELNTVMYINNYNRLKRNNILLLPEKL